MFIRDHDASKDALKDLPEDEVVREILEPLSNKQRLQMLKALSIETKTFSALSASHGPARRQSALPPAKAAGERDDSAEA